MPTNEEPKEIKDYIARGLASEAIQAMRSHDALDTLRFENMEKQHEEIKTLIHELDKKMDRGFKSYDAKFWSLAITVILLLLTIIGSLLTKMLWGH